MEFVTTLLTLLGAIGITALALRFLGDNLHRLTGHKIAEGTRAKLKQLTPASAYHTCLWNATCTQNSLRAYTTILSYTNSRLLTQNLATAAMAGAVVGELLIVWFVAMVISIPDLSTISLPLMGLGFLMTILFYRSESFTLPGRLFMSFALLLISLMLTRSAMIELMIGYATPQDLMLYTQAGPYAMFTGILAAILITAATRSTAITVIIALVLSTTIVGVQTTIGLAIGAPLGLLFPIARTATKANPAARRATASHATTLTIAALITMIAATLLLELPQTNQIEAYALTAIAFTAMTVIATPIATQITKQLLCKFINAIIPNINATTRHLKVLNPTDRPDSALSLIEAAEEIINHTRRTCKMMSFLQEILVEKEPQIIDKLYTRIEKYEKITDRVEDEILGYICQINSTTLSEEHLKVMKNTITRTGKIEQIADHILAISHTLRQTSQSQHPLTTTQLEIISHILAQLQKMQYNTITIIENNSLPDNETLQTHRDIQATLTSQAQKFHPYNQCAMAHTLFHCEAINNQLVGILLPD